MVANHLRTNSQGSQQGQSRDLSRAVSSNGLGVCCNRSWSICRQCVGSMGGNRDGRSCGLNVFVSVPVYPKSKPIWWIERTILHTILQHQFCSLLTRFPPRCNITAWRLSAEGCKVFVCLVQDGMLLFDGHSNWILVRVAMEPSTRFLLAQNNTYSHIRVLYISCPASLIIAHSSGNVSREWPGMNHVVLILYLSNSFRSLRTPTVPAKRPVINQLCAYH